MEELDYIMGAKTIVELLGRQNFTNEESAILELVILERSNIARR